MTKDREGTAFESADGKYLYITPSGNDGALFRMPVAGGSEVEVAPKVLGWPFFSVTSKGLDFLPDPRTLQLLEAATGKIETVANLEKYFGGFGDFGSFSISPNDAYMVFSEWDYTGSDLMLVENFR